MKYAIILSFFLFHCFQSLVAQKPNILIINVDELRADALGITGHPFVKTPNIDRIAKEGIRMKNSFVTTPLCGPSRCSLLTGQYAHTNGMYKNTVDSGLTQRMITYPLLMQYAGYKTAFIGKLTTGVNADLTPHPGFDRWFCTGTNRDYKMNPTVNVDGVPTKFTGHETDIDFTEAIRFIKENKNNPFCVNLFPRAVHTSYGTENLIAAERHRNLYKDAVVKRAISADSTLVKQPALKNIQMEPPTDEDIRNMARMLVDIDENVGLLLKTLEEEKLLDKTMIIFTGDNGFFFGEHGLTEKRFAYEEAIRVPFFVRYPPFVKAGSVSDVPVLNIDIAPTVLSLAGLPVPRHMEGLSLLPLLKGGKPASPRDAILFEFWPETQQVKDGVGPWKAVRTDQWKYIHWINLQEADELYNLKDDPLEIKNLVNDEKYNTVLSGMKEELSKQMKLTHDPSNFLKLLLSSKDKQISHPSQPKTVND